MTSIFNAPQMQNEEAAYAYVEARVWPNGPVCPHCGGVERIGKMAGKATRIGLYKCYQCRRQFNVKVGTIFEASHLPLTVWLQAMFLMASSKKGISSNQLHRSLGVTLKTAWFLSHRIREAMTSGDVSMFGAGGDFVEVDETYIGHQKGKVSKGSGAGHKIKVLALVDRASGKVRSFADPDLNAKDIHPILRANIAH